MVTIYLVINLCVLMIDLINGFLEFKKTKNKK